MKLARTGAVYKDAASISGTITKASDPVMHCPTWERSRYHVGLTRATGKVSEGISYNGPLAGDVVGRSR